MNDGRALGLVIAADRRSSGVSTDVMQSIQAFMLPP